MEARDLRSRARENLAGNWGTAIGVAAVAFLLGGLLTGSTFIPEFEVRIENMDISSLKDLLTLSLGATGITIGFTSLLGLAQFIIGGVIELGYAQYLLKQHDRRDPQFSDLFSKFDYFGAGFCQAFLRGLYTFLWSLLFIIPGIVAGYSYAMTPFILSEHPDMPASEAIRASKELMYGHKGELFWLDLTFIGWSLLSALTLNLGNLWLNPYRNAAYAAFYCDITSRRNSA